MKIVKNKKTITIYCLILLLAFSLIFSVYKIINSRTFQFFGGLTSRVNPTEKIVALTLDDAPTPYVQEVLSILKNKNVKATFYIIGKDLQAQPALGQMIAADGHELGNHSYYHNAFLLVPPTSLKNDLASTNYLIRQTGYQGEITFRPPYGKKFLILPWILKQNNIRTIMWDVEPDTFYWGNRDKITDYTVSHTKPGSIIIMHPFCEGICQSDRQALPDIIDRLRQQDYRFVTVSELLESKK